MEKKKHYKRVRNEDMDIIGRPMAVKVPHKDAIIPALKVWKRKLKDSNRLEIYREKMECIKPTTKRRKEKQDAIRRNKTY